MMCPISEPPSREKAMTSATEFASKSFNSSLPSHCLTSPGSLSTFVWLCEKRYSKKSVDRQAEYVSNPEQPTECDHFICLGSRISSGNYSTYLSITDTIFPPTTDFAQKTSMTSSLPTHAKGRVIQISCVVCKTVASDPIRVMSSAYSLSVSKCPGRISKPQALEAGSRVIQISCVVCKTVASDPIRVMSSAYSLSVSKCPGRISKPQALEAGSEPSIS
ncbi:hypothetical protein CSKR_103254 [Clonorchis sinensis]|uniref:Uncharacterized protein n=1 Tax=Clonorchis sinensis TaxID=79923 RepID=A0A419Q2G7_CLOSI|nr:hypothetical protein CSKR_103254 [Clonorchis sinensis]